MIRQTNDMEAVNGILAHPDIWSQVAPEGIETFNMPYFGEWLYFIVNEDEGVIIFHPYLDGWKIHPNIIPERRGKAAFRAIDESVKAVFEMGCHSVYAEIDRSLKHVTWAAKQLGFNLLKSGDRDLFVRRNLDS